MKKKILLITPRSSFGGAPKHIDILIKNLSDKFDFYFASPLQEPYGISWYNFLGKDRFCEIPYRSFSIKSLFKLALFIKKENVDIIHAHGKGAALYARLVRLLIPKTKVIYTLHGLHIEQYNKFEKASYLLLEKFLALFTDLFINVSEGERAGCLKYKLFSAGKSKVIYNAIEDVQSITGNKYFIRKQLNLPVDKFIIVTITRFDYQKNMEEMINIAEKLKTNEEILFLWVGDGESKNKIIEIIEEKKLNNVLMPGYKSNIMDYLTASDLYLSNSRWEGLPYSLIEACLASLPIVATNVVGNNEIVKDNYNGRLFIPGDYNLALRIIKEIYTDSELLIKYSENSRQMFLENFQLDKMLTKIDEVYRKL